MGSEESLHGKNALVTAGASGLGKEIAMALARAGADVEIWDRDVSAAGALAEEAQRAELTLGVQTFDLTDEAAQKSAYSTWMTRVARPDILVNNAGGSLHTPFRFLEQTDEHWDRVMRLNVTVAVQVTRMVLPHMLQHGFGRIINLGSKAGRYGSLFAGANYAAAKGAIHALTLQLAQEFGPHGITCNAICPGATMTERVRGLLQERQSDEQRAAVLSSIPVRRHAEVADIARTAVFLASPASEFITGVLLDVNGGQAMST